MKLTPVWRNRLRNLTTIFLVLTVVAIIYTLIQWIRSEPGSFEPLNVLFFAVFSVASAISAWLSRPANVRPPANSTIAVQETPALGTLRHQITSLFSLEELRVLCFDLGIRYDDLPGNTISTKAASLLAYADRRGQLDQLMVSLQRERPYANWPLPNILQQQYILRRNVRATWIEGVLKQSVTDEIALELKLTLQSHALTRKVMYVPGQQITPIEKDISALFAEYGSLLILGEPGSGKTMILLQLAESLLNEAEWDSGLAIPVILNLSTWAEEKQPLIEWLVEELWLQYQLMPKIGRSLVQNNQLIYLLDGLDEVDRYARSECITAINTFQAEYTCSMVVSSRIEEYEILSQKANLSLGILINPLSNEQVEAYLKRPELNLDAVYSIWQKDKALQKLAQTPLFLSVMALSFRRLKRSDLDQLTKGEAWQKHIYQHYMTEMFKRRPLTREQDLNESKASSYLINLAHNMKKHEQTIFYIERMQPTWLPTTQAYYSYMLLTPIITASIWVLIGGLFTIFSLELLDTLLIGWSNLVIFGQSELILGLLIFGLIIGFLGKRKKIEIYEFVHLSFPSPKDIGRVLIYGLVSSLIMGGISGILFMFNGVMPSGEAVEWNFAILVGFYVGSFCLVITVLIGGITVCLQVPNQLKSPKPNRPIHSSFENGLLICLLIGLVTILGVEFFFGLIGIQGNDVSGMLTLGMNFALIFGIIGGLVGGLEYGVNTFIQHYTLRWLLARTSIFPFSIKTDQEFVNFLDAMKERILLRRVGSGWMFIHRTLLDYFAFLHPDAKVGINDE